MKMTMTRSPFLPVVWALALLPVVNVSASGGGSSSRGLAFVRQQHPHQRSSQYQRSRPTTATTLQHFYATEPSADDVPSSASVNNNKSNDDDDKKNHDLLSLIKKENKWGIPHHSTLEPLGQTSRRRRGQKVPHQLPNGGKVTLVGSGPGDPDLLTVAAYKLLTQPPEDPNNPKALVIADRLVSQEILDLIPDSMCIKVARKLPGCAELAQEEIYRWVHQGLQQGKHVIRLKIGDPFVFGRGGEEVLTFRNYFGVEAKVIPGVSSAFAAPLLGSIPVTHRGKSQQVVMCTGYGREGTSPDLIQYHKEQTVVFLMAVGRLRELSQKLINLANYPPDTPVGIVERAGCPNQRTVVGNLMTIADVAERHNVKPPSVIVVGEVVNVLQEEDEETGETVTGLIQNMTSSSVLVA